MLYLFYGSLSRVEVGIVFFVRVRFEMIFVWRDVNCNGSRLIEDEFRPFRRSASPELAVGGFPKHTSRDDEPQGPISFLTLLLIISSDIALGARQKLFGCLSFGGFVHFQEDDSGAHSKAFAIRDFTVLVYHASFGTPFVIRGVHEFTFLLKELLEVFTAMAYSSISSRRLPLLIL
ncbi:hypothetical protein Tco_0348414 [Tanacetum coccineum]